MLTTVNNVILHYGITNYDDHTFTLSNKDGSVISVNPAGQLESRPEGTHGPWESFAGTINMATVLVNGTYFTFGLLDITGL